MGIGLAWCATDRELIVAMTPQNVMAYLRHGPRKSLAAVAASGPADRGADAPSMLVYIDTAKLFELVYPFVPLAVVIGMSVSARNRTSAAGRIPFGPGDPSAPGAGHGGPAAHETGAGIDQPATVAGHGTALDRRTAMAKSAISGATNCRRGATQD